MNLLSLPWKHILQRIPGVVTILYLSWLFWGPIMTPITFAIVYTLLHILFISHGIRSCYAVYKVYHKSVQVSKTNYDVPETEDLRHIIILPNYKEGMDTLCETLDVLASHSRALSQYQIILAMESSEKESLIKAKSLVRMYSDYFLDVTFTVHPADRAGEIRGKSSNVAWASAEIFRRLGKAKGNEIITVMDADTCFAQDYFLAMGYEYMKASLEERQRMMFCPPTVFDRNANQVPSIVRVADMMWSAGVMSTIFDESPVKFPCSAYSVPLTLAHAVGFWDADPGAIGEDMHMYLKCFFGTHGQLIVKTIHSPASQCNVDGSTWIEGIQARYTQGKRHLWGCLDTGYTLRRSLFGFLAPGYDSGSDGNVHSIKMASVDRSRNQMFSLPLSKLFILWHRVLEAHLIMGYVFLLLVLTPLLIPNVQHTNYPASFFWDFFSENDVHPWISAAMTLGSWIQFSSFLVFTIEAYFYEHYHQWVGTDRWLLSAQEQMTRGKTGVSPLGKRPSLVSTRSYWQILDWAILPLVGLLFMVAPMLEAHLTQLFTDKLNYKVAAKPSLAMLSRPNSDSTLDLTSIQVDDEIMDEHQDCKSNISISSRGDSGFFDFEDNSSPLSRSNTPSPLANTIWKSGLKEDSEPVSSWMAVV